MFIVFPFESFCIWPHISLFQKHVKKKSKSTQINLWTNQHKYTNPSSHNKQIIATLAFLKEYIPEIWWVPPIMCPSSWLCWLEWPRGSGHSSWVSRVLLSQPNLTLFDTKFFPNTNLLAGLYGPRSVIYFCFFLNLIFRYFYY